MASKADMVPDEVEAAGESVFRIFRSTDAPPMIPADKRGAVRKDHIVHPETAAGMKRAGEVGMGNGAAARVLYSGPGMHIAYAWFKSGFPLPLHSHDADCFYQVIAGEMHLGTELLRKGDGVLIPAGVPYTVAPGAEGVEFLEIRPTGNYDTRFKGKTEKYWDRIVQTLTERQPIWADEKPPFGLLTPEEA